MGDTEQVTASVLDELRGRIGEELGVSDWHEVTQDAVNAFAHATGDHQWIHVDVERARKTQFGGTIAHGYYTLSLSPKLTYEILPIDRVAFAVNYGLNKVRFPAPLPVGERVRMRARLNAVDPQPGGAMLAVGLTFERDGADKPVCVAEALIRVFEAEA